MYILKKIIPYDQDIQLPKCMYNLKRVFEFIDEPTNTDQINIHLQVMKFLKPSNVKMAELELRQDQLLKKLDMLYEKIKMISLITPQDSEPKVATKAVTKVEEIVLVFSPENLPWYLVLLKGKSLLPFSIQSHIHSSVPSEKATKIKTFTENFQKSSYDSKITLRLIFKYAADPELKLSSLSLPIIGNVNILRFLSFMYPSIIPYDCEDYNVDALLDMCHLLERIPEKNKEALISKLFSNYKNWIYKDFSIVDLAAYSVIKQSRNGVKYVPKEWYSTCERLV